jgi:hypothetical protein
METDDAQLSSQTSQEQSSPSAPGRRSKNFRNKLLSRLPTLAAMRWEANDTLDVYREMQSVVDVEADSFLQPLSPLVDQRHD